jgi:hypothetical protein
MGKLVERRHMANWFYLAGSLCFLVGTVLNMVYGQTR